MMASADRSSTACSGSDFMSDAAVKSLEPISTAPDAKTNSTSSAAGTHDEDFPPINPTNIDEQQANDNSPGRSDSDDNESDDEDGDDVQEKINHLMNGNHQTIVLDRKPASDDCLTSTQFVQEGDTVLLRYAVWNHNGSLFAASHESYPYRPYWHCPGRGICAGLDSKLLGMSCGEFAAIQFAGPDMDPCDPTVRVDPDLPFLVVDVEVLAIAPRTSEFTIQWLSRLEDVKLEANRLLKAGEIALAVIQYQACTEILEHHINSHPKPDPSAAALLATLHLNQSQAYLTLREPKNAEVKARAVFGLALAPPTTVATTERDATPVAAPLDMSVVLAAGTKVSATPIANMLRSSWTRHRFDLPESMLRKAAFRLTRSLLDQNLDTHAHAVCAEAFRMWPSAECKADFAPLVAQINRNREKVKKLAKTMLKDIPPPPPELLAAQAEKERAREEERKREKEAEERRKRAIEEHRRKEEAAIAAASAAAAAIEKTPASSEIVVDDSDIDMAALTPEQREFLQLQREAYAREMREAAIEESDEVKAAEWAAARDEFGDGVGWAETAQERNAELARQAGSRMVVKAEWSSDEEDEGDDKDNYVSAKDRVSRAISDTPDKPKLATVDGYDSDEDAPMPDPAEVVPGKLSLAKIHADIARTYQPRTQYSLSALVSFFTTNYAAIRPWVNRWRDLCHPLVDHIVTQLMVAGIVELYDIGARKNNPQALPVRVQAIDLLAASLKGASARALAMSAMGDDDDDDDDDGDDMPSAAMDELNDDTVVPITSLANNDQGSFRFMLMPCPGVHFRPANVHLDKVLGPKVEPFLDPNAVRNIRFKLVRGNFAPFGAYNVDKMAKAMVSSRLPTPIPKSSPLFLGSKEEMAKAYIGYYVREGEWELLYDPKMGPKHAKVYVFGGGESQWPAEAEGESTS